MFYKITEEYEQKKNIFKDENLVEVVNDFINMEINDLIFCKTLGLINCESPMEQLFSLNLEKFVYAPYWILEFFKNKIEFLTFENQVEIGKYRVDFLITIVDLNEKIIKQFVVEVDGHDFHEKTKEQAQKDKEKDRFLTSEGYIVVRFTGSEIYNQSPKKARELLELIVKVCGKK